MRRDDERPAAGPPTRLAYHGGASEPSLAPAASERTDVHGRHHLLRRSRRPMSEKRGPTLPALEGVLLLEQPLLHAPYDQLRRALRTQQRLTEHEFRHCHHALAPLRQSPGKHTSPAPLAGKTKHPRHHAPSSVPGGAADEPLADMSLMSDMSMDTSLDDPRGAAAAAAERRARTALAHARTGVPGTEDGPKLSPEAQAAAAASVSVRSALGRLKELRRKVRPQSASLSLFMA